MKDEAGLDERALRQALEQARPYIVDISARVVEYPGKRDEADAALDVLHLIDAALSGQQPADVARQCTVCHAVVASYPEGMCCHCRELPWPIATTPPPVPDRQGVEAMTAAWVKYDSPYDDRGFPEHHAAVARHAFGSGYRAALQTRPGYEDGVRAETLAQRFHETYERLAPSFGYETREASAKPWADVPEQNKRLMIAVCGEILALLPPPLTEDQSNEG